MADASVLIESEHLRRRFGRCEALGDVSFQVRRGEIAALLGPNGAGKTTLLRILAGALPPTSGQARIAGWDVEWQSLEARRHLSYLPENTPLYPEMRVQDFLRFRGQLRGLHGRRLNERLRKILEECELADCARRRIGVLSRGDRQRVALADCLLPETEVLLLDDPFTALDPAQARLLRERLLQRAPTTAILFSTHVLAQTEWLAHRVLLLHSGRLAASGAPADLVREYGVADLQALYDRLTAPPSFLPPHPPPPS